MDLKYAMMDAAQTGDEESLRLVARELDNRGYNREPENSCVVRWRESGVRWWSRFPFMVEDIPECEELLYTSTHGEVEGSFLFSFEYCIYLELHAPSDQSKLSLCSKEYLEKVRAFLGKHVREFQRDLYYAQVHARSYGEGKWHAVWRLGTHVSEVPGTESSTEEGAVERGLEARRNVTSVIAFLMVGL